MAMTDKEVLLLAHMLRLEIEHNKLIDQLQDFPDFYDFFRHRTALDFVLDYVGFPVEEETVCDHEGDDNGGCGHHHGHEEEGYDLDWVYDHYFELYDSDKIGVESLSGFVHWLVAEYGKHKKAIEAYKKGR